MFAVGSFIEVMYGQYDVCSGVDSLISLELFGLIEAIDKGPGMPAIH